ncbi:DUF4932 domain-containing protein [Flavobacterium qiangtangense]|uniref:DUF4932 domain-containing protein n=1 Tax=Flavobacterium qiangtangense TaxID=1442595 RepID=A0ABW1PUI9_9FLAO
MHKLLLILLLLSVSGSSYGQKNVRVEIDPRIEAITLFYTLATIDTFDRKPTPSIYYKDFNTYFKPYKNHPSLTWYRNLARWDAYDLSSIGLYLSDSYPFQVEIPYAGSQLQSADMTTFLSKFNLFYKEANVKDFIKSHKKEYARITDYTKNAILKSGLLQEVERFYNRPSDGEMLIYVDALNNQGSNAITIDHNKFAGKKMFKLAYLSDETLEQTNESPVTFMPLSNVLVHEVSHLFVSDFIPKYKERLEAIKHVFLTTAKGKTLPESEWQNELDELIVRVCVAKILGIKYGAAAEAKEVENQSKHFKDFKAVHAFFDNYTSNRTRYKNSTEFYPELILFLETLA